MSTHAGKKVILVVCRLILYGDEFTCLRFVPYENCSILASSYQIAAVDGM